MFTSNVIRGSVVLHFQPSIIFNAHRSLLINFDFRHCSASQRSTFPSFMQAVITQSSLKIHMVGCFRGGCSSEASSNNHAFFHVEQVVRNNDILEIDFSYLTFIPANARVILYISPTQDGTPFQHVAKPKYFIMCVPIILFYTFNFVLYFQLLKS